MSERILHARQAMGRKVSGEALVAKDGFSAHYDLDRLRSMFLRPVLQLALVANGGKTLGDRKSVV